MVLLAYLNGSGLREPARALERAQRAELSLDASNGAVHEYSAVVVSSPEKTHQCYRRASSEHGRPTVARSYLRRDDVLTELYDVGPVHRHICTVVGDSTPGPPRVRPTLLTVCPTEAPPSRVIVKLPLIVSDPLLGPVVRAIRPRLKGVPEMYDARAASLNLQRRFAGQPLRPLKKRGSLTSVPIRVAVWDGCGQKECTGGKRPDENALIHGKTLLR